jgi:hypothetical protein
MTAGWSRKTALQAEISIGTFAAMDLVGNNTVSFSRKRGGNGRAGLA